MGKIREDFIAETKKIKSYFKELETQLAGYDNEGHSESDNSQYLRNISKKVFPLLDCHFSLTWEKLKEMSIDEEKEHRDYYYRELIDFFVHPQINRYIHDKPLGYAGDYVMMNFIYDHGDDYYGKTTYEKLINSYTCNIPISSSNRARKDYLKSKIKEIVVSKRGRNVMIASIGCGPAREIIEIIKENELDKTVQYQCVDFEKKAIAYVRNEYEQLPPGKKEKSKINLIEENVISLIHKKAVKELIKEQDLIYCFGVFDYINDRIAGRLIGSLVESLNKNGKLIVCNASERNSSSRAYYEVLGGWQINYRNETDMLSWFNGQDKIKKIYFENPKGNSSFLFLLAESGQAFSRTE